MLQTSSPTVAPGTGVLKPARNGRPGGLADLFDDCYPKIVRVVRRRLSRPMRKLYDSTDIANEVMKSLAAKFDHFDFSSIDGLRAFLIQAAEQKVVDGYRTGPRPEARPRPRSAARRRRARRGLGAADSSPTASQVAVASEEEEILLEGQSGEHRDDPRAEAPGAAATPRSPGPTGWHLRKVERFLGEAPRDLSDLTGRSGPCVRPPGPVAGRRGPGRSAPSSAYRSAAGESGEPSLERFWAGLGPAPIALDPGGAGQGRPPAPIRARRAADGRRVPRAVPDPRRGRRSGRQPGLRGILPPGGERRGPRFGRSSASATAPGATRSGRNWSITAS